MPDIRRPLSTAIAAPDTGPPIVEFREVSKSFGTLKAVAAVSLAIRRGEFFSLLGPSGCGKTTTLRLLAGLEHPDADGGEIRIAGASVIGVPPYQRRLGMVFQSYALFPHLSVGRNVAYGLERHRVAESEIPARVARALELVRLPSAEFARRRPQELSGGQRQRVALARALVLEPELLLLDEPLGAIDLKLRKAMQLELRELNRQLGITFVYVTHDQDEALTMSDRIAVMDRGRVVQLASPVEIYERPRNAFVAGFIGEANLLRDSAGREVALRPERIEIRPASDPSAPGGALPGRVEQAVFLGERTRLIVLLDQGQRIAATIPNDGRSNPLTGVARGDRVLVSWRAEDGWPLESS